MSHQIYQTEAVVLSRRDYGEGDRLITFFTEEFGKIGVVAQGVRQIKSKLRYNLEPLTLCKIAVVFLSSSLSPIWRLTDAEEVISFKQIKEDKEKTEGLARISIFLNRMIQGEEKNKELWALIKEGIVFLESNKLTAKNILVFESVLILNILDKLGYISENKKLSRFFVSSFFDKTEDFLLEAEKVNGLIVSEINLAIKASHL